MSGREWKPGDVAHIPFSNDAKALGLRVEGGWITKWNLSPLTFADARPLVVIDPEDREQMRGVAECAADGPADEWRVDMWQRYFRGLANPTPPKPDEPTGLGAVVEDVTGLRWVRARAGLDHDLSWRSCPGGEWRPFSDINVAEVHSDGVTVGD